MSNEEKAEELRKIALPNPLHSGYGMWLCSSDIDEILIKMAEWKERQLDKAIDKALEHHSNRLKEGKITQYGMDNVFAFVQNIRTLLNNGINIKETN